jgi:hypothetical protein
VAAALTYGLSYLMLRMFMVATRTPGTEVSPEPAVDHAAAARPFVNA